LWPFVAAGYPDVATTGALLRGLSTLPIRGVEVGFPFSDPIADGPVIQRAFSGALARGVRVGDVFEMVSSVRGEVGVPLLAMVSASIVYRIGTERFASEARAAGFDGLIVPDLSLEEAPDLAACAAGADLRLSMLIAPTTPPERERRIAEVASGFLYYVSVQGTTGERGALPDDLEAHVTSLREGTGLPVLVGFGISGRAQVQAVCGYADGAIVGSAIVRRITELVEGNQGQEAIVSAVRGFVGELAGG
jgi:tryptophan synthase alpha chain